MPLRGSWLAVQTLINQHLADLAILAEVRRQKTNSENRSQADFRSFFSFSFFIV